MLLEQKGYLNMVRDVNFSALFGSLCKSIGRLLIGGTLLANLILAAVASERQLADVLPESTVLYAEAKSVGTLADQLLAHPLYRQLAERPEFQAALSTPQFAQFRGVVNLVETRTGTSWDRLLHEVTGRGVALAVDGKTGGAVLVGRGKDKQTVAKLLTVLLDLVRQDAQRKNRPDPVRVIEYRGVTAYRVDGVAVAVIDEWFLVTNQLDLGKVVLDCYHDRPANTLANKESFRDAFRLQSADALAWAYLDLQALRQAGLAAELFKGKANDPGGELLLGGVLGVLPKVPFATAELRLSSKQILLRLLMPMDRSWVEEHRHYYFGPEASGSAPALLTPAGTILSLSTYRDLSQMWLRAGDLFDKETNERLAQADSQLTTLFSGHDFGEDILGSIGPQLQLVLARQEFSEGQPVPALRLPALALVAELKKPETMQRELRRIFQSFVGFINIVSAMNGQPQLELDEQRQGSIHLVLARFVPPADRPLQNEAPIQFNFSPTLGFSGSRVVLASSVSLAQQLLNDCPTQAVPQGTNSALLLRSDALWDILTDNRRHLITQNVLTRGRSREEAEREVEAVLSLLKIIDTFEARMTVGKHLTMESELRFRLDRQR